jgi:membrane protein implicated in regulation of membrane protease activity
MLISSIYVGMAAFWLILTIIFLIIEAVTVGLATVWFAAGSLVAFILAMFNVPIIIQVIVFIVVSCCLLIFTRKIFVEKLKTGAQNTNVDALPGQLAQVIMDIEPLKVGQVQVNGLVWSAIGKNNEYIKKDQVVKIIAVEGVKLIVTPVDQAQEVRLQQDQDQEQK